MIYYLNRGFIAEQAIADLINKYLDKLRIDEVYQNFHVSVTNDHPFAHLIFHDKADNTADSFPAVVVTTMNDNKLPEFNNVPAQLSQVILNSSDIDVVCKNERQKMKIVNGVEVPVTKKGQPVFEQIPGYCIVTDKNAIDELKKIADEQNGVYGLQLNTRKRDAISIEIWCENNQLKNELYEQLRLYLSLGFERDLYREYKIFDPAVFEHTVHGERSNNYNMDFDVILYGSHLTFDIDYNVAQIIIDTEIEPEKKIEVEVENYVKE